MCTPRFRWFEEQSRHRYTPNGTEDQVGFFWPQSKHTCGLVVRRPVLRRGLRACLVRLLGLEFLEDFLRLALAGTHLACVPCCARIDPSADTGRHMYTKIWWRWVGGEATLGPLQSAGPLERQASQS